MPFLVKDWKDTSVGLLASRPTAAAAGAGATYYAIDNGLAYQSDGTVWTGISLATLTLLNAAAIEDLETRLSAYTDTKGSNPSINALDRGVVGNGTTDDRAAIQALINEVTALSNGGTIVLPPRVYGISAALEMKRLVRLVGYHHPHWIGVPQTTDTGLGTTIRALTGFTGANLIQVRDAALSGGTGTHGGAIEGIALDGNNVAGATRGLYIQGNCKEWQIKDVEILRCIGNGFEVANYLSVSVQDILATRVYSRNNGGHGFALANTSDHAFMQCIAEDNTGDGWNLQGVSWSQFSGCKGEWNDARGLFIGGALTSEGLKITDFSTDSNYKEGVVVGSCSYNMPILFNGLYLRRDGRDVDARSIGIAIGNDTDYSAPVVISDLEVVVRADDGGGTLYRPITGLKIGNFVDVVLLHGQYIWGVTTTITNSAGASKLHVGKPMALVTGNPGVQARTFVTDTTTNYTV